MATMKRRVIYFADEEWADLERRATEAGMTISAYLRGVAAAQGTTLREATKSELAKRAEIRPNPPRTAGFNTRPFTPVPKRGK